MTEAKGHGVIQRSERSGFAPPETPPETPPRPDAPR
jgi:hypothetical protein